MKKLLAVLLISMFALVGCGKANDSTLKFAIWDDTWQPAFQTIIDEFESQNPDIKIKLELTPYSEYWQKLDTVSTTNKGPDLFVMNAISFKKYQESGIIAPITDAMKDAGVKEEDFKENILKPYQVDGEQYVMPFNHDMAILVYNPDVIKAAGATVPTDYDDVFTQCQKLLDYDPDIMPYLFTEEQSGWWSILGNMGGEVMDDDGTSAFDQPVNLEMLEFVQKMAEKGYLPPSSRTSGLKATDAVIGGLVGFAHDGSWMIPTFQEKYADQPIAIAPIPTNTDNQAGLVHAPGVAVNAKGEHVEEAQKFAAFIGSDFAAETVASEMNQLSAKKGFDDIYLENNKNVEGIEELVAASGKGISYPAIADAEYITKNAEIMTKLQDQEIDAKEAAKQIDAMINESVKR
ncbi:MAG: ABC transporter substrate-binding protein [Mycoplasmatales bacterium]